MTNIEKVSEIWGAKTAALLTDLKEAGLLVAIHPQRGWQADEGQYRFRGEQLPCGTLSLKITTFEEITFKPLATLPATVCGDDAAVYLSTVDVSPRWSAAIAKAGVTV